MASPEKKSPVRAKKSVSPTGIYTETEGTYHYNLKDLIRSDFDMPAKDKDFKLSHEQLIKACKILLHKINFQTKRTLYENEQSEHRHQQQYYQSQAQVNS